MRNGPLKCCILLACVAMASPTLAQRNTTIQLPTFQTFSMTTSVLVPDRGTAYLGGVNRAYAHSSRRGSPLLPNANRSVARGASSSGVHVSAFIHDHAELDGAVLREWELIKAARRQPAASRIANTVARNNANSQTQRVAATQRSTSRQVKISTVRTRMQAKQSADQERAKRDFLTGWRLEQKGKLAAARVMYTNASQRATGELKQRVASRLEWLDSRHLATK